MTGTTDHTVRLGRVEQDVDGIRQEMGGLKADVNTLKSDVKAFGSILERIEQGVVRAQDRSDDRETQGKPSLVAMVSVLITIISIIVGGSWVISGQLARQDAAITRGDLTDERLIAVRDREIDQMRVRLDHVEDHVWDNKSLIGTHSSPRNQD